MLSMLDVSGHGLEIGPSYNPFLRKDEGYSVETLDYASQDALIAKYRNTPDVDVARIEPVDYVSDGRSMREIIGKEAVYDFVIASHVIEHTPDLIGFLNDCETLLKPEGTIFLAVPDKRCCFDLFESLTSTGEVLDAYDQRRTRPGYGALFNEAAYGAKQDGSIGWPLKTWGQRELARPLAEAHAIAEQHRKDTTYRDVHVWRFVPSSFELIMNDLYQGGKIALRIDKMIVADEMMVTLSRQGQGTGRSRLEMLEAILDEQAVPSRRFGELLQAASLHAAQDEARRKDTERIDALQDDLAEAREALTLSHHQLQAASALRNELAKTKEASALSQHQLQAVYTSRSWRLTALARSLSIKIRSLSGRA